MSGLSLRASRLLFTWQLFWLLVQAAPAQPVALDPVLLSSVAPGSTEPWPSDQQTPPMNSFMAEDFESLLLNTESSALPAEAPEETEAFPAPPEAPAHQPEDHEPGEHSSIQEDTSAQSAASPELDQSVQVSDGLFHQRPASSENVGFSVQEKSSALPQLPIAGAEPPSVHPKGPALPPKSSTNHEVTVSSLDSGEAQRPVLPYLNIKNVDVGGLITPKHPMKSESPETEKEASAEISIKMVKLPIQLGVPPKSPEKTELSSFHQETLAQPVSEGDAIQPQQTIAPPQHPEENYLYSAPIQDEQPTYTDITVPPFNLEVTITPVQAKNSTSLTHTAAPSMYPEVTFPHPEPVQAQQPSFPDVTVPPLDLELTITPETTVEAVHHPTLKKTTAPPKRPEVTLRLPGPGQAQQPSFPDVTVPPLDLELTITPETTVEAVHHPTLKKTTAPPKRPEVTLRLPEPGQAQQPSFPDVTVPPLDLELTIIPETTVRAAHHPTLKKTTAPPKRPEVTLRLPEPGQAQQPTFFAVTVPPLDLELTTTPEHTVEAEYHPTLKKATAPPKRPEMIFRHPEPGQAQQPTFSDVTVPSLDLELTITAEPTVEAEHPIPLWQTGAPPRHPHMIFPQPEPVQAQQQTFSDVRVPPVVLELTIRREAAEEAEHHPNLKRTTAPPKQAEVTFPHPEPLHAQHTTFSDVRVLPLNLEPTVPPEPTVEAEHARALQQTAAPPKHPLVTFLVQDQQPTLTEGTGHSAELEFIRTQRPETSESGPPVNEQNALMNICKLCTCKNETLSCTGLSPKQRLHRVPVLYPQSHNGSFTILNFKGNSISYINKDTWESFQWVEKLILSENNLRELHKDSFEGLLSLQYLDLSSNKIELIERNTFESMPFLQQINLHNNLITKVRFGTFQAWHGMQFLHKLILSHNPLTTVEDSYLFKLPALRYLDLGKTQVSLTTVESTLLMALKLRKLILPSHLACCLCQFKSSIEAVGKTVKLHCDSDCLTHTQCDEELYLGNAEGSLMKVLQGREKRNSPELTIEPERASPGEEKGGGLPAFMNLLMKLLTEQEEVKVSKADWDTDHWGDEGTEALVEGEEQESRELRAQAPGHGYKNKLVLAAPVIAVATLFTVIFCLMAICQRRTAEDGKEGTGFFSIFGHKRRSAELEMEEGGFQRRWPLWLWDMYWPLNATHKGNVEQNVSDEGDLLEKMEKGEASTSTAKAGTSDSAAEETAEETDA